MLVQAEDAEIGFHIKRTQDVDLHAQNLAAWDQHYEQTSPGAFSGVVHELVGGDFQLFEEVANRATSQRCQTWQGGLWIGLAVPDHSAGLRFMGRPSQARELMLARSETPFDLQVPAGHGLYGLVLDQAQLEQHMQVLHHHGWPAGWASGPSVQGLSPLQDLRLRGMWRAVLRCLQEQPQAFIQAASRRSLREALMTVLCDVLLPQTLREAVTPRQQRRQNMVNQVRERVLAQPDACLSVADLCTGLHITRRTLQNCFQDVLGMSPAAYLRTVRLNAVRRALRAQADHTATIADTAARWGFWHMGHFSQDYKALFGETPSQTRLQA